MISATFFAFFFGCYPHPFRGVETDKIINSEVIYEHANYNQTALIQVTKCVPNARKMQTKEKQAERKNQLTNGRKCNSLHLARLSSVRSARLFDH